VTQCLKARIEELENTAVAIEQLITHAATETNTHPTTEKLVDLIHGLCHIG
jgi:hypothetical protein